MNYLNDLRTYPELRNFTDEQLLARGIDCLALQTANREKFDAEDNYEATYGKRQAGIRRRLKKKIKSQTIRGTAAGEWSARKSQLLKEKYEDACERANIRPYKGKKSQSQKNLSKWSKQNWRTASGRKSSITGEPYFPAKAVEALKKKGLYAKARRQKRAATKSGKQNARYSDDIRKIVKRFRSEERGCYDCPNCGHQLTERNSTGWGDYCYCFTCEEHFITKPLAMIAAAESRPDWEDIDWKTDKPPAKENEDWGDDVEWDAENKEVALKEFDETDLAKGKNVDDHLAWQLKKYSKINEDGNIGCPECGSVDLFAREFTDKGVKWNCWDCMYSRKIETLKSQKDITLEKFGLVFPCAKCGEDIKAFNRYSFILHQRKCEGKK
jgi:ribosomal protein L37AE/L43A